MYHVNPVTGEVGICKAKSPDSCPFGCENHSENLDDIQIKSDKINKSIIRRFKKKNTEIKGELDYSLEYLNNVIDTFGLNKKSIQFYLNQLENIKNIGQINSNIYFTIKRLVKNSSLSNFKTRIESFNKIITDIDLEKIKISEIKKNINNNKELKDIYNYVLDLYEFSIEDEENKINKKQIEKENVIKNKASNILKLLQSSPELKNIIENNTIFARINAKIIKNACSGEFSHNYIYIKISSDIDKCDLDKILRKEYIDFGYKTNGNNPCSRREIFNSLGRKVLDTVVDFINDNDNDKK